MSDMFKIRGFDSSAVIRACNTQCSGVECNRGRSTVGVQGVVE